MVEVSGELCCERTGMALSQHMRQGLSEVFIDRTRAGRRGPDTAYTLGGPFFCPGCGEGMKVEGCHATCRRCGGVLDEFVYPLIEVHPHP